MMWLIDVMTALDAAQFENLLWAALYLALAGGMNARLGAGLAAVLALALVVVL